MKNTLITMVAVVAVLILSHAFYAFESLKLILN